MDANRYFDAMHNAMSAQHPGAQLLLTVKLQDTCGNDACLELKQLPGESTSILCYSTMGRRCLNFQLFRKGWQLCHNADGQLVADSFYYGAPWRVPASLLYGKECFLALSELGGNFYREF